MKNKNNAGFQVFANLVMAFAAIYCLVPLLLLLMSSLTDNNSLILYGYSLFPKKFSLDAYRYLIEQSKQILRAFGVSALITSSGVLLSLTLTTMLGYTLARKDLPGVKFLTFFVFFTMLFNGGLVPTYLMYTGTFHIKNTLWALLIPNLLVRAYYVILVKNYFSTSIPKEILESAYIDGASEFQTFSRVALPMAKPIVATVGLFQGILYWNDWQNGFIYITTKPQLYSIQNLLNRMIQEIQFLAANAEVASGIDMSRVPSATVRMAIAVVGVLPIIIIYPFLQKNFTKGITMGAVKG